MYETDDEQGEASVAQPEDNGQPTYQPPQVEPPKNRLDYNGSRSTPPTPEVPEEEEEIDDRSAGGHKFGKSNSKFKAEEDTGLKEVVEGFKETVKEVDDEQFVPYELRQSEKEAELDPNEKPVGENQLFSSDYKPKKIGLTDLGTPEVIMEQLAEVGYACDPFIASQVCLMQNTPSRMVRTFLLEGPPGCGKTFMAQSLAKITGAELLQTSCYPGMNVQDLIESRSHIGISKAMAGKEISAQDLVSLGPLSRAFQLSQEKPVIFLIDEIDKTDEGLDTFFLGPLNDARIWLESGDTIDANLDNLLVVFTKNFNRALDDALLRRVTPVVMTYLDSSLEKKVLKPHVHHQLSANLVFIAETMRTADGAYKFERPPAPDELLRAGRYLTKLIDWEKVDFSFVGKSLWPILAKNDHDRKVFEQMLRFHPEFADALIPDPRKATDEQIYAKLGRVCLKGVVEDPDADDREIAFQVEKVGWPNVGGPDELTEKLSRVGYQALPYLSTQISLVLNTQREMVKTILLEGPPGCGKSFFGQMSCPNCGSRDYDLAVL